MSEIPFVLVFDEGPPVGFGVEGDPGLVFTGGGVPFVLSFDGEPTAAASSDPNGADRFNFPVGMTTGRPGESAYQIAQRNGFAGTEDDWLLSLRGVIVLDIGEDVPVWTPVGTIVYRRVS